MNLTLQELSEVAAELGRDLVGGVVQEVRQPSATAICLSIRRPGQTMMLLFETAARLARMHLTQRRPETLTPIPAFCAKLRKELTGTRVFAVEMPWPDRVVVLSSRRGVSLRSHRGAADPTVWPTGAADPAPTASDPAPTGLGPVADAGEMTLLIFEGSGHHSNLFLTDEAGRILAALRPSSSHQRDLLPGRQYVPPVRSGAGGGGDARGGGEGNRTDRTDRTDRTRRLGSTEAAGAVVRPEREGRAAGSSDGPTGQHQATSGGATGPSARIDLRYSEEAERLAAEAERVRAESKLRAERKKVERTLAHLEQDEKKALGADRYRQLGDLLKINLRLARRGMDRVTVPNVYSPDGEDVEIPLDPSLGPKENMEKLFLRYRKGVRGLPKIRARRQEMLGRLLEIEERLRGMGELPPPRPLADAGEVPPPRPLAAPAPRGAAAGEMGRGRRLPYRRFESAGGRSILVGREGKDNHALTFQVSSPHDVWLHVRGFPGCHVVIPLARGQEPDTETLLDAAHLAVHFSKAPKQGFVEVMWTRRKNVRAVKKGRPGQVLVEGDRTVAFHSDPARVERLLASRASD